MRQRGIPSRRGWRQRGRLHVWTYGHASPNYAGWHISGDADGLTSMIEGLDHLRSARQSTLRLQLTPVDAELLAIPNHTARASYADALTVVLAGPDELRAWAFDTSAAGLAVRVGSQKLGVFIAALRDVLAGQHDFCLGPDDWRRAPDDQWLWFWLHPSQTRPPQKRGLS